MTLRYFGGMTVPEVAEALGVAVVTAVVDGLLMPLIGLIPIWSAILSALFAFTGCMAWVIVWLIA